MPADPHQTTPLFGVLPVQEAPGILRCVGCEREAPVGSKPEPCGNWLCRACTADMRWAMTWMARVMGDAA